MLLLEELMLISEPVLLNQLLHNHRKRCEHGHHGGLSVGGDGNSGVYVCVPPLLFGGTVWCAGWSRLGGGAQPLLSGLHALDLQLLWTNNQRCELSKLTVQLIRSSVSMLLLFT